eukprot:1067598-Prorocentrum_lima.AAC.1
MDPSDHRRAQQSTQLASCGTPSAPSSCSTSNVDMARSSSTCGTPSAQVAAPRPRGSTALLVPQP